VVYEADAGNITIALTGDAMINRRMSTFREPAFLELVELLRGADATIVNLEQGFHEWDVSYGSVNTTSFQVAAPSILNELKWMGVDAASTAMNHAYDYGEAGLLATLESCKRYGLPQAGSGTNLGEARAPIFLDTPRGRVAFMAAASARDVSETAFAGPGRSDFPGKPGINALRSKTVYRVPPERFEALKQLRLGLKIGEREEARARFQPQAVEPLDETCELRFMGQQFRLSDDFGMETTCHPSDLAGIGDWIRGARKAADWLVYGFHFHDSAFAGEFHGGSRIGPPDFAIEFARFAIDQGCDAISGHGSHFLRGIELYNGRPIFYSLGNFIFQNETVQRVPVPAYEGHQLGDDATPGDWGLARSGGEQFGFAVDPVFYRTIVPVCEFAAGALKEIRLYPVDLGFGQPMSQRGRPVLAGAEVARATLEWLRAVSEPFGTEIEIEGSIGIIRVPAR
jgi:poly-gamma-glutamate capsule biosynthesis protein CapA/YwtB (metallophosphatase superfamily)